MKKTLLLIISLIVGIQVSYAASYDSETECEDLFAKFFFNETNISAEGYNYQVATSNGSHPLIYTEGVVGQALLASPKAKRSINFHKNINGKIENTYLPDADKDRTISLWYKYLDEEINADYLGIFFYGDYSFANTFGAYVGKKGEIYFQGYGQGNDFSTDQTYDLTNWLHLAYTYDGDTVKIYVNGVEAASSELKLATSLTNILYFNEANAAFDDLRIYERALSGDEILGLYEEPEVAEYCFVPEGFDCTGLITKFFFNLSEYSEGNSHTFVQNTKQSEPIFFNADGRVDYAITVFDDDLRIVNVKEEVDGNIVPVNLPAGSQERTVALWMRYIGGTPGNEMKILQYGSESNYTNFGIYFSKEGKLFFRTGASGKTIESPNAYNLTEWTHIAVVVETDKVRLYVNGVNVNSVNIVIGTAVSTAFNFGEFNGYVDDLRIYSKALTPKNITALYTKPEVAGNCDEATSVRPVFSENDSYAYPNPATHTIHFKNIEDAKQYTIIDVSGRQMEHGFVDSANPSIQISHLREGYYFVRFDNQQTLNFIKH